MARQRARLHSLIRESGFTLLRNQTRSHSLARRTLGRWTVAGARLGKVSNRMNVTRSAMGIEGQKSSACLLAAKVRHVHLSGLCWFQKHAACAARPGPTLGSVLCCCNLEILTVLEQETLKFPFALSPANYIAGPVI